MILENTIIMITLLRYDEQKPKESWTWRQRGNEATTNSQCGEAVLERQEELLSDTQLIIPTTIPDTISPRTTQWHAAQPTSNRSGHHLPQNYSVTRSSTYLQPFRTSSPPELLSDTQLILPTTIPDIISPRTPQWHAAHPTYNHSGHHLPQNSSVTRSSSYLKPFRTPSPPELTPPERTPPALWPTELSPLELNRRNILPYTPADSASSLPDYNEEDTPRSSAILQELNNLADKNKKFDLSSLGELGLSQNELETLDNSDKEEKMLLDEYWTP